MSAQFRSFSPCRLHIVTLVFLGWLLLANAAWCLEYDVTLSGPLDSSTRAELAEFSDSIGDRDKPPASAIHLRRRVVRDQERFVRYFRARGHYAATVRFEIDTDTEPAHVLFTITPGPRYLLREVSVTPAAISEVTAAVPEGMAGASLEDDILLEDYIAEGVEATTLDPDAFPLAMPSNRYLGLRLDRPFIAGDVRQAQTRLLRYFRDNGYPFPTITQRRVIVDHAETSVQVVFEVAPGRAAAFGELRVQGLEKVREQAVRIRLPWEEGDRFDMREMETYQRRLYDANLFSTVRLQTAADFDNAESIPILLDVVERKHRTIATGLTYRTDEGAGAQIKWEHRNFRGRGHRLGVESNVSQLLTNLKLQYDVDYFRQEGQKFGVDFEVARENTDAYDASRVATNTWLQRKLNEHLTVGVGLGLRSSDVEQRNRRRTYHLFSVPTLIAWDHSNDPLNPTEGFRLSLRLTPYVDLRGSDMPFLKSELVGTHYWALDEDARWVLATRLRLGAMGAGSFRDVPPDIRFYAGGGGSVRGYGYQLVSPLEDGDPIGGRSVIETNIEIRRRLSENFGVVAFLDAGAAQYDMYPSFSTSPRYGAGVGVRYFSPLGPLRFDVAAPLNKRSGVDSSFQMYISIGQAF